MYSLSVLTGALMKTGYKFQRLYGQLMEILKTQHWESGDRFLSETQICLKFDVSRQTVRKALAMLVDDGYLQQVQGSGTYITEKTLAMQHRKTNTIGILVTYLSDYIFPVIIKELEKQFTAEGFSVQLASSGNSSKLEGELLQKMLDNQVDGIILEPTRSAFPNPNVNTYRALLDKKFPLVTIHSSYRDIDIPTVALNDKKAGAMACNHLLDLGHTEIGAILKADDLQGHKRYEGILEAHENRKLIFNDKNVYWYTTEDISNFSNMEDALIQRLSHCSAVICYNDQIAIEYERILLEQDISIPEEQSIVSIDNSKLAPLAPVPLTSIESPIQMIGIEAGKKLLDQIHGQQVAKSTLFEPKLVKRMSSTVFVPDKHQSSEAF
jgi:GntR family transcriptional regulator of arabinose operon